MTELEQQLLVACEAQHEAIDRLFALLIEATGRHGPTFHPSKSGQPWDALNLGNAAIMAAKAKADME